MKPFAILVFVVLMGFVSEVNAQSEKKMQRWFNEAKQFYDQGKTAETISSCNKVLNGDPDFVDAHLILSDIYNQIDSVDLEIYHLQRAKEFSSNSLIIYRLAEANYSVGNYAEALGYYITYTDTKNISEKRINEIQRKILNCEFAKEAKQNPVEFQPQRLSENVNSINDEYWPSLSLDQQTLVFTRLLKTKGQIPQEDFFIAEFDSIGWGRAQAIIEINSSLNEGAQSLSADGKLLFFTACNRKTGFGSCDIYYSRFLYGKWSTPQNAGREVNSGSWEAQPSFSADKRYLYFSSNRAGGKGKKDIWRARFYGFLENGKLKFDKPENLGNIINTVGDEISPFIHPNMVSLYFASDFHVGMGGFDLFQSDNNFDGTFSEPVNLGFPINTFNDEQGLIINPDGETAYFASAREKNSGLDIYTFQISEEMRPDPVSYVKAKVLDAETQKPIQAKVELQKLKDNQNEKRLEMADENGEVMLSLPVGANYAFNVSEEGYLFYSKSFQLKDLKTLENPFEIVIELAPIKLGAEMNLYNIYFETDSFSILPDSEPELQKLTEFLKDNSLLNVEIQGHTDSSGNSGKNQELSESRAKSVVEYLINSGIEKSRMNFKGFGDTHPVTTNETIEGRKLNRRTTIKILGIEK